jgi:hypothetical protein
LYKQERRVIIKNKLGRPKSENPRSIRIGLRMTQEENRMLEECIKHLHVSKTEIISLGIKRVYESIRK